MFEIKQDKPAFPRPDHLVIKQVGIGASFENFAFVVAANEAAVKQRAKADLLRGAQSVHTDDLYEIDDCLEITEVDLFGLQQTPDMHRKFTGVSANLAYTMVQYLE